MNFLKRKKEKIVVNIKVKLEIGFLKKLKINLKKKIHQLNIKRNKGLKKEQNQRRPLAIAVQDCSFFVNKVNDLWEYRLQACKEGTQ